MMTKMIAEAIKKSLNCVDGQMMRDNMLKHYRKMHLVDDNGKWVSPEFEKIGDKLLPSKISIDESCRFVDEVAQLAEKNPYLMNFLQTVETSELEKLNLKLKNEANQVFPDVVAYAIVLDKMTKAMYDDPEVIRACVNRFQAERKRLNTAKHMSLFHKVKLMSVEQPMKKVFLKAHDSKVVSPKALRFSLPLNIFEASFADFAVTGYRNNGRAGFVLAANKPGNKSYDPSTGAGPSTWSKDGKGIYFAMPLTKEWDDLYQTWNMAFCSQIPDFPMVLTKLFIPQVANYQDEPGIYIYNRAIALYLHLNHAAFECVDISKGKEFEIDWYDKKLTAQWGKANYQSAKDYTKKLSDARKEYVLHHKNDRKQIRKFTKIKKSDVRKENSQLLIGC